MASVDDDIARPGWVNPGSIERSRARYARATRHSDRVRLLKLVVPLASFAAIAAFLAASVLYRALPASVSFDRSTVRDGTIVMDNPVLTGQSDDRRPFSVTANQALQEIGAPDVITLRRISASLPVGTDETASVTASGGVYDRQDETLSLEAPLKAMSSGGIEVEMQAARFDLEKGDMVSDLPIRIVNGETELVAQSVRMHDNGASITFDGGVRMTIAPSTLRNNGDAGAE